MLLGLWAVSHVLDVMNSAAMNVEVHAPFWIILLSGYIPRNGVAGSYDSSAFSFLGTSILYHGGCTHHSLISLNAVLHSFIQYSWVSLVAQLVKNPPTMRETWVRSLGWEDSPREEKGYPLQYSWAPLVSPLVKNPPAMQETWVQSLDWEDSLEKGKDTHSSILAWRIPCTV